MIAASLTVIALLAVLPLALLTVPLGPAQPLRAIPLASGPWLPLTALAAPVAPRLSMPRYCPDVLSRADRIMAEYNRAERAMMIRLDRIPYTKEAFYA